MSKEDKFTDIINLGIVFTGTIMMLLGIILLIIFSRLSPIIIVGLVIMISIGLLFVIVGTTRFTIPMVVFVKTKEELLQMLTPSEKKIVNVLLTAGMLSQSEIAEKTGFSPAKVSRLVKRLEGKRIIIRYREDKKKLVKLREEFLQLLRGEESK